MKRLGKGCCAIRELSGFLDIVEFVLSGERLERVGNSDEIASKGVAVGMEESGKRRVAGLEQFVGTRCSERCPHLIEFIEDVVDEGFDER